MTPSSVVLLNFVLFFLSLTPVVCFGRSRVCFAGGMRQHACTRVHACTLFLTGAFSCVNNVHVSTFRVNQRYLCFCDREFLSAPHKGTDICWGHFGVC